ncbi:transcriptional regulator with XRE-family HTH domain [Paenibacillus shirakamiensis]|uniref:Transcriptional regulator with XRE-family HTH domain n=1 Tax=Paenibacillus shirakamiensis TaxID=1265935 RepID=A0ABS4JLV8_9BACL|nr:helix-turn-helix transcriptional regulator [Paenibacillus shirakamiensis]MBP2002090.1 transcriptional regulator with XRE-family HTH domain [Paenibacillus shirakamiensis]
MNTIGTRIKHLRKQRGMTQTDLAGEHMTKSMLSQIENGKAMPSMRSLRFLAEQLGQEAGYFLDDEGNQEVVELLKILEVCEKRSAYEEILDWVEPLLDTKLPMTIHTARLMEFYAAACFYTAQPGGEEAIHRAIEIYQHFGLYMESSKAKYMNYAHLFSQNKLGSSLDLIREVWAEYESKKIGKDIIFELDLFYAQSVTLAALGLFEDSHESMLAALALSQEEGVYYLTDHFLRMLWNVNYELGEYQLAESYLVKLRHFTALTDRVETHAMLHYTEAWRLNMEGLYDEAYTHLQKLGCIIKDNEVKLKDRLPSYWLEMGIYHYYKGMMEQAHDDFSKVTIPEVAYHPLHRSLLHTVDAYLARMYAAQGNLDKAKEHSAKAYELVKSFPKSRAKTFIKETYDEINKS